MFHRVVMTAGLSGVSSPTNFPGSWVREHAKDLVQFTRGQLIDLAGKPPDPACSGALLARWKAAHLPATKEPEQVSAEYSMLHVLKKAGRLAPNPQVVLIRTDTEVGRVAAEMTVRLIERDFGADVTLRCVADLSAVQPSQMRRSLGAFMDIIARELQTGEQHTTCFAPLGGYKVMTALGYLTGAFLHYPTAYVQEHAQVLHEVPWVPISIDREALRDLAPAIRQAVEGVQLPSLDDRARQLVEANPYLFERADQLVMLNAFGIFLRGQPEYRGLIGTRILFGASVPEGDSKERDVYRQQIETLLSMLVDEMENRGRLHHEANFGHRDADFHLYKGASQGELIFRAAWRFDAAEDTLRVNHIWTDHALYEREAKAGKYLSAREQSWRDVTAELFPMV